MKKLFLLCCFFVVADAASGQSAFYYCNKGGKKLVSDRPCEEQGAKLTKKVRPEELYPISSGGSLSENGRERVKQIDDRLRNEESQYQKRMQKSVENHARQQHDKERICGKLNKQKERIISRQRIHSTPQLNNRHKTIDNKLYEYGC